MDGLREIENPREAKLHRDSDSRLQGFFGPVITDPSGKFQRTFCFLCGKPYGWCSTDTGLTASPAHIVVTCDRCDADILTKCNGDLSKFPMQQVPNWLFEAYGIVPERATQ
jgi:hypothetical protein